MTKWPPRFLGHEGCGKYAGSNCQALAPTHMPVGKHGARHEGLLVWISDVCIYFFLCSWKDHTNCIDSCIDSLFPINNSSLHLFRLGWGENHGAHGQHEYATLRCIACLAYRGDFRLRQQFGLCWQGISRIILGRQFDARHVAGYYK